MSATPSEHDLALQGKKRLLAFVIITVAADVLIKALAVTAGYLKGSNQAFGVAVTITLMVFLWLGSRAAWWITLVCLTLTLFLGIKVIATLNPLLGSAMVAVVAPLAWLLLSKSTRTFTALQRKSLAKS